MPVHQNTTEPTGSWFKEKKRKNNKQKVQTILKILQSMLFWWHKILH